MACSGAPRGEPLARHGRAAPERWRFRRRDPVAFELVIKPSDRQRAAGHVQAGDQLADLRRHLHDALRLEEFVDVAVQDEQFLILCGSESVDDYGSPSAGIVGALGENRFNKLGSQVFCRHPRCRGNPRLAVDAKPEVHVPLVDGEQRFIGTGKCAPVESDAEGVRRGIGRAHHALDFIEVRAVLCCCRGNLVHSKGARDTAPFLVLLRARRRDIVGYVHDPGVDSLADQPFGGDTEVQSVTGVVAEAQHNSGTTVRRLGDPIDLLGGW